MHDEALYEELVAVKGIGMLLLHKVFDICTCHKYTCLFVTTQKFTVACMRV